MSWHSMQKYTRMHGYRGHHICLVSLVLALALAAGWTWVPDAWATDPPGPFVREFENTTLRLHTAESTAEKRLLSEKLGVYFYGYLEGSYTQNFNNPSNRINELRIFDVNSNEFRPNLAQFNFRRAAKPSGNWIDRLGFKVKFNAGKDSDFIGGLNLPSAYADFQEAYLQYLAPIGGGLNLQVGQINSIIGYEWVGSPWNPNYSRSWMFGLGQPFTMTGVRAGYAFNNQMFGSLSVIRRINSNLAHGGPGVPWLGGDFEWIMSRRVKLTLFGIVGPGLGDVSVGWGGLLFGGGFVSFQATKQTSFVVESYYANQIDSSQVNPGKPARWGGVAGYFLHDFTKEWGLRVRAEIFDDPGGFVTCGGTTATQPRANVCFGATSTTAAQPVGQTLWETTITLQYKPQYKPLSHWTTRLEYRYDKSDHSVFQLGDRATNHQSTLTFDAFYSF